MKVSDELKVHLKTVVDHFDMEDRVVREFQLRRYRRLKLYWNSFSQIYWSESAKDFRVFNAQDFGQNDQSFYDRPVNVFRAFLETIIAALSIQVPKISCSPDDADNPNDISTAKAGDKIAELLYKHNDAIWLWLHALYIHMTEGMVACYTYPDENKKYGTYQEKKYKDEEYEVFVCPHCQAQLDESILSGQLDLFNQEQQQQLEIEASLRNQEAEQFSNEEENEFAPDDEDVELQAQLQKGPVCPECGVMLDPALEKSKIIIPKFVGMNDKAKSRICMKMYGGLYVKVADYAMDQSGTPYLILSYETHYSNALERWKDMWDEIPQGGWPNAGVNDPYEQYARLNPQYRNGYPEEQVTIKETWLRPSAFNILERDFADELHKKFPNGAKVCMVNDLVVEVENESLDDCWTLTKNPLHDYLCHDPYGELLVNVQDITNDLISLTIQTIEHGIAQTWVDPAIVDLDGQRQVEAQPGTLTATKPQGGARNISEAFHSTSLAHLSPEIFQFYNIVNQLGQFVSAAMPSIFGGSQQGGSSGTASEYAMSRTASLQRLQTTWRTFSLLWKDSFGKAIPAYMKLIKEDERYVTKDQSGNFVNSWIRKTELQGKIGSVEIEASEQMPISDEQKAEWIMKLMELNNQEIIMALTSPENLPFILKVTKMPEFKMSGEADRQKQLEEIQTLSTTEPIPIPVDPAMALQAQAMGQQLPTERSSVEVDPIVDNHKVEADICRGWLVGEAGRLAKVENPKGYMNVLLHMKEHLEIFNQQQQEMMMQQMQMQALANQMNPSPAGPGKQPAKPKDSPTVKESGDVRTPIK